MSAVVMDTKAISATLLRNVEQDMLAFSRQYNQTPGLVIIGFGEDRSTIDIARIVGKSAPKVGLRVTTHLLAANIKASELRRQIEQLNNDPSIHAISLQLPLPRHLDVEEVASYIAPEKDVEGLHPNHQGRAHMGKPAFVPPPALSALRLLNMYKFNPAGRHVVIVGRNLMIGRPLSDALTKADATVTLCHSVTGNLPAHTRQAEILITAAGKPGLIKAEMVRPGAVVIDFGINYLSKAHVVGDVDFEGVASVAGAVTPMPGGTGPMTIICLMENVLKAARLQQGNEMASGKAIIETEPFYAFRSNGNGENEVRPAYLPQRSDVVTNPALAGRGY